MFNRLKYTLNNTDSIFIDINKIKETAKDDNKCELYKIPLEYSYRPDLIADHLYRDVTMADYIAILNDISDSPEGFYAGRILRVLKSEFIGLI